MDRIRTLLLARTHVVVMDPDLVARAATRPSRDIDIEQLEDELAQLGFVASLDLASMLRRLPYQTIQELRDWIYDTLAREIGAQRPQVPRSRELPRDPSAEPISAYARRISTWLRTQPVQPCPWCGKHEHVGALDPCGHLVCRTCWSHTAYTACPTCHRRVALGEPFLPLPASGERVIQHSGTLVLLHLGFDVRGIARERFRQLLRRELPLCAAERAELEALIDTIGPAIASWLPGHIAVRETMAVAIARLWLVAPDRAAIARDTAGHVQTATDVLRIAAVLMGGSPALAASMRLRSLPRGLRRALLEALERLPLEEVVEDMRRHARLWKRIGERLHPFERADKLPNVALAFAVVRRTNLGELSFGAALREQAVQLPFVYVEDGLVKPIAWAGPIEDALRAGNPRSALVRLTHRPAELLRRADHLVRLAQTRQLDALQTLLKAVELAATKAPPAMLLTVAAHAARRSRPWPRRVFFPHGNVLNAWVTADRRTTLRGDAIAVMVGAIRRHLCNRAEANRQFPRALIDRALVDLVVPVRERAAPPSKIVWPRGSELALPEGQRLRVFLHWEAPARPVELDLAVVLFDASWRHVATCDASRRVIPGRSAGTAAVHDVGDQSADAPGGTTAHVDLHVEQLQMLGARHAIVVVSSAHAVTLHRLAHGFVGVTLAPPPGEPFDARAVDQHYDLRGRSPMTVPLLLDLGERRVRWLDVHVPGRDALARAGGFRAALAHVGRDFSDQIVTHARPTLWDVACVHAAARANVVYIRERDGSFTTYRRRDNESKVARLGRLMSGAAEDGRVGAIPAADAPTWFALMTGMPLPKGSVGYVLDERGLPREGIERISASELVAQLAPVPVRLR